jgi:shikimate dehydrogenase
MRALGIRGLSVTMPHKTEMARLVDDISPDAERLNSVNTLLLNPDGRIAGYSTDGDGLISSLRSAGITVQGRSVVMFGAGGAARSVADALVRHGCAHLDIVNRTLDAAQAACRLVPQYSSAVAASDTEAVADVMSRGDLIINATSIGMGRPSDDSTASPVDHSLLRPQQVVVDLVYHPRQTAFLTLAARAGCTTVDGLGMLIHQAALQQQIWTGQFPDVEAMTRAAHEALETSQAQH